MERKKKDVQEVIEEYWIHLNASNQMILIHSNVSKFFKKQHTNTLHCFANRYSLDESSNSMDKKFFLKNIEVTRFIGRLLPLTPLEGQSQESVNKNQDNFF